MKALLKIKTLLWKILLILIMLLCMTALPVFLLGKWLLPKRHFLQMTLFARWVWGRTVVFSTGSRVTFEGYDQIPDTPRICFVGNHQSYFDIPAFLGWSGQAAGFIAKKELFKIPILSQWMRIINCVFIDRSNPRLAIKSFQESAEVIKAGYPQIIFPEGTRSKSDTMGSFLLGSIKLPQMADAAIVPFAIKGSWRTFEIDGNIHSNHIKIRLLPAILTTDPVYHQKTELLDYIKSSIQANLDEM